jgi:hypothetical protein
MRYTTFFITIFAVASTASAQSYDTEVDYRFPREYAHRTKIQQQRLDEERYETDLAREEIKREQMQMQLEAQRQQNEIGAIVRREQEESRRNYEATNMINNVNNAANTASNVARQIKQIGNLMNHGYNPYDW